MSIDSKEIKQLLSLDETKSDSTTKSAFDIARNAASEDPVLEQLRIDENDFDRQFASALQSANPPADLKSKILQAYQSQFNRNEKKKSTFAWFYPASFGFAAATILILVVNFTFLNPPIPPTPAIVANNEISEISNVFHQAFSQFKSQGPRKVSNDFDQLVSFLQSNGQDFPEHIPSAFSKNNSFACDVFSVDGFEVGLVCFRKEDQTFHMFSIDKVSYPLEEGLSKTKYFEKDKYCGAMWEEENRFYYMVSETSEEKMRQILEI